GEAVLRVTRTFSGEGGDEPTNVEGTLSLPEGAVVSGLRVWRDSGWQEGRLLGADEGSNRYGELLGGEGTQLVPVGLVEWQTTTEASLRLFPLAPLGELIAQVDLRVPARYEGGHWYFDYPEPAKIDLPATFSA